MKLGERYEFGPVDLAMFVASALLARVLEWSSTDLVWSLWLSSLLVGYSTILGWVFQIPSRMRRNPRIRTAVESSPVWLTPLFAAFGVVFSLAFFTFHFGMFHFVHSVFLFLFFPIASFGTTPDGILKNWLGFVGYLIGEYGSFVVAAAVSTWTSIRRRQVTLGPDAAYKNVVRMHIMIFVFAAMKGFGVGNYFIYVLTLLVFFFPIRRKREGSPAAPGAG